MNRVTQSFKTLSPLLVMALLLVGLIPNPAAATTYPLTLSDDLGREITFDAAPQRIVSLAPSHTKILFELGLGDRVVGVTDYCDYPPEAAGKDKVGGPWTPDAATIVSLNPDLVLASDINPLDAINALEALGLTVFGIESTDLPDLLDDIRTVGLITDHEAEANALTAAMQARIDAVADQTAGLLPAQMPRTCHIMWHDPIWTSGTGTYIHDVIVAAGGQNIFDDLAGYNSVDIEALIARDPEVIIVTAMGGTGSGTWDWVLTEPRLADVSARLNGRVYYVESNWVERAGPRIVLGLEQVAKHLHPEIFFDPWDYDADTNGSVSKAEAIAAVQDYFNGLIAKTQAIEVLMLYFA